MKFEIAGKILSISAFCRRRVQLLKEKTLAFYKNALTLSKIPVDQERVKSFLKNGDKTLFANSKVRSISVQLNQEIFHKKGSKLSLKVELIENSQLKNNKTMIHFSDKPPQRFQK